jgi:hypothetical protein
VISAISRQQPAFDVVWTSDEADGPDDFEDMPESARERPSTMDVTDDDNRLGWEQLKTGM